MKVKTEQRTFNINNIKTRDDTDTDVITLTGYASVFNSSTMISDWFEETIEQGAFTRAISDNNDIRCLFNHDWAHVLGRTKAGTLRLEEDDHGLKFEVTLPNTTVARDLVESLKRGDINQCSFGFIPVQETWNYDSDPISRVITDVDLMEVSIVSLPAYEDTEVDLVRSVTFKEDVEKRKAILKKIKEVQNL
ncbi:HK97 family phage prohead protease [Listeria monocytogenes]|uniref:HK97 family phage prohead protease n=1 Tax=Listeria TaxID=1637 RepID=UPI000875153B|nr:MULTISPECIES: HK97 family phage prohead protease [Listeria]EAE1299618.1 HK97 family phage prohead protease [Listeria monocytogenes]EAF2287093.1 HK97 family phage prohead protease [Listeria monocytogenes]EAF2957042.1 HK97 family phage prohead protease [Listeria monocytogenes]EAW7133889.1 HK97 family phage prohead protease [Listeria monocytogenes]EIP0689287.1 HK97 family phage prohead protease [Listeria monocytogenes]